MLHDRRMRVIPSPVRSADGAVGFVVPCRPRSDLVRLEAVLRALGVAARIEIAADGEAEPAFTLVLALPVGEHPEERPADVLGVVSPAPGFAWEAVPAAALAAALTDEFGPGVVCERWLWSGGAWEEWEQHDWPDAQRHEDAAEFLDDRWVEEDCVVTGAFDPHVLRSLARRAGGLQRFDDHGTDITVVWPGDGGTASSMTGSGVSALPGAITFLRTRYERVLMIAADDLTEPVVRTWSGDHVDIDPTAGHAAADGHDVRRDLAALGAVEGEVLGEALRRLSLDADRERRFVELWERGASDDGTFARLGAVLGLPALAAELAEGRAGRVPEAVEVRPTTALGTFRDVFREEVPSVRAEFASIPDDLARSGSPFHAWYRFSARHPRLRWVVTGVGIALPALVIALHPAGVRESPLVPIMVVAIALWGVDALIPRRAHRERPSSPATGRRRLQQRIHAELDEVVRLYPRLSEALDDEGLDDLRTRLNELQDLAAGSGFWSGTHAPEQRRRWRSQARDARARADRLGQDEAGERLSSLIGDVEEYERLVS